MLTKLHQNSVNVPKDILSALHRSHKKGAPTSYRGLCTAGVTICSPALALSRSSYGPRNRRRRRLRRARSTASGTHRVVPRTGRSEPRTCAPCAPCTWRIFSHGVSVQCKSGSAWGSGKLLSAASLRLRSCRVQEQLHSSGAWNRNSADRNQRSHSKKTAAGYLAI